MQYPHLIELGFMRVKVRIQSSHYIHALLYLMCPSTRYVSPLGLDEAYRHTNAYNYDKYAKIVNFSTSSGD